MDLAWAKTWGIDTSDPRIKAFWEFHKANPHVYTALRRLALGLLGRGRSKWGIGGLFEVMRWRHAMVTEGDDFKLNNNFRAYYARLLMSRDRRLKQFFDLRSSVADTDSKITGGSDE